MRSTLERLLAGDITDPRSGQPVQVETQRVVIEERLDGLEAEVLDGLDLDRRLAVVSDPATREALGARVERALSGRGEVVPIVFPAPPHPDQATVDQLAQGAEDCAALVAVGSGTINDLCKFVAAGAGKPYVVYPTAPSMNGYVSANAAITIGGHKKSLPAAAPLAVAIDLSVLSAAPPRLIRAGLGDSLCRPTAQADWLLSHLLFDTPYDDLPFRLLAEDEDALFAGADGLLRGDPEAMARLVRTLLLSGFGMSLAGGSYPASQGEHLICHYMEMMGPSDLPASFHGEQVAVATLTMAKLQAALLAGPPPRFRANALSERDFERRFGAERGRSCWAAFAPKALSPERAEALTARLAQAWDGISPRLASVTRPAAFLKGVLDAAEVATEPAAIGWSDASYGDAVVHAREIRDRYTFLDLAWDSGRQELLEQIAMTR